MNRTLQKIILLFVLIQILNAEVGSNSSLFVPLFKNGDRVVFIGDSMTRAGEYMKNIQLFWATRYPEVRIDFFNAGISGDTAEGALRRLNWDIAPRNANYAILLFGINDLGFDGYKNKEPESFRNMKVGLYQESMEKLLVSLRKRTDRQTILSPPIYEETALFKDKPNGIEGINKTLKLFSDYSRGLAQKYQTGFVNLFDPMMGLTLEKQKNDPSFTLISKDRIHPGSPGYLMMSWLFLKAQQQDPYVAYVSLDRKSGTLISTRNAHVDQIQLKNDTLSYRYFPKSLPFPIDPHLKKDIYYFPFIKDLNQEIIQIQNLPSGKYDLIMNGTLVETFPSEDFAEGVNLATLEKSPSSIQAKSIADLFQKKQSIESRDPRSRAYIRHVILEPNHLLDKNPSVVIDFLKKDYLENIAQSQANTFSYNMSKLWVEGKLNEDSKSEYEVNKITEQIRSISKTTPHLIEIRPTILHSQKEKNSSEVSSIRETSKEVISQPDSPHESHWKNRDLHNVIEQDLECFFRNLRTPAFDSTLPWLFKDPMYESVLRSLKSKNYEKAAFHYRDFFVHRLFDYESQGWPSFTVRINEIDSFDIYSDLLNPKSLPTNRKNAEALYQNPNMTPGHVWIPPEKVQTFNLHPWTPRSFAPLAIVGIADQNENYIKRWVDLLHDWSIREPFLDKVSPLDVPDCLAESTSQICDFYRILGSLSPLLKKKPDLLPPVVLARILNKMIRVYPALSFQYHRSNTENWTSVTAPDFAHLAMLGEEFIASDSWSFAAKSLWENYTTGLNFPDGTEAEREPWYNANYLKGAIRLDLYAATREKAKFCSTVEQQTWGAPLWRSYLQNQIRTRTHFLIQHSTPDGRLPIGSRSDRRVIANAWNFTTLIKAAKSYPSFETDKILFTLHRIGTPTSAPSPLSVFFPYGGYSHLRQNLKSTALYGFFFSPNAPSTGHALRGMKNINTLGIGGNGQDLLVTGAFGAYSYERAAVRVDNQEPFFHAGLYNPPFPHTHKGFLTWNPDPVPNNGFSFDSSDLAFTEGTYKGPYGFLTDDHHDNKSYTPSLLSNAASKTIRDTIHHRQVIFIKPMGSWIVVDRMNSNADRSFTQDWYLPLFSSMTQLKDTGPIFTKDQVQVDRKDKTLKTTHPDAVNLNIQQFSTSSLQFSQSLITPDALKNDYTIRYVKSDLFRFETTWKENNSPLISWITTTLSEKKMKSTTSISNSKTSTGFISCDEDGQRIDFMVSNRSQGEDFTCGNLKLNGTLLLWWKKGTDEYEGLAYGVAPGSCSWKGKIISTPHEGVFRLHVSENTVSIQSMHKPLHTVSIEPRRNYLEVGEKITLQSPDYGVEIRYTLDGNDPSFNSPLYTTPFKLPQNGMIKTRAFRHNLASSSTPPQEGFDFSFISEATYNNPIYIKSDDSVSHSKLSPGVLMQLDLIDWKDVVPFPKSNSLAPYQKVASLFAGYPRSEKQISPLVTYSGWIKIPKQGVYTFTAPPEWLRPDIQSGYTLKLSLKEGTEWISWNPSFQKNDYGQWSVQLEEGYYPIRIQYADLRGDARSRWNDSRLDHRYIGEQTFPRISIHSKELNPVSLSEYSIYTEQ